MEIRIYQVDAFTEVAFGGNPAAVCPLDHWISDDVMQMIAMENNLSETAFFVNNGGQYEIRWFTPEMEIDLCGHATLASAHVIFEHLQDQEREVTFKYKEGILKVVKDGKLLKMDFPATPAVEAVAPVSLIEGLKAEPLEVLKSRDFLVIYPSEKDVLSIVPDFQKLVDVNTVGIIVTAPGKKSDFVSRFFAPRAGIPEDPVTGSAHCTLIPYWADKLGKNILTAFQASRRGGKLACEFRRDRVIIAGSAVTFMHGEILLDSSKFV